MIDKHPQDLAKAPPKPRRQGRRRTGLRRIFLPIFVFFAIVFGSLAYTGQPVSFPRWATDWVQDRMNAGMGQSRVRIGDLELQVISGLPRVLMRNVTLTDPTGASLGQLNTVRAGFAPDSLARGIVAPSAMTFSGAQITIRRSLDGRFTLSFGGSGGTPDTLPGLLDRIDATFTEGPFRNVRTVEATDLTIALEDARIGRLWQATNGSFRLENGADDVAINVFSEVFNGTEDIGGLQFSFQSNKADASAALAFRMDNMAASDIAAQAPVLGYLDLVDAPIDGAMRSVFAADGTLESIAASLEIGKGVFRPGPDTDPIGFSSARAFFDFDAIAQKLTFTEASVATDLFSANAEGLAYVTPDEDGRPEAMLGQLRFNDIAVASGGYLPEGATFDGAGADFRLTLDPFAVELGEAVIRIGDDRVMLSGHAAAAKNGWDVALNATSDHLTPARVLGLWPDQVIPNTKSWLVENLLAANLRNISGALRIAPGQSERVALSFDYDDAVVRVLEEFPPVTGGAGHAGIFNDQFSITIEKGTFDPGAGGLIDVAGSSVQLDNIGQKPPPPAQVNLKTDSSLEALLTIMDNAPFRILQKANQPATLAEARAIMEGDIRFLLEEPIEMEDVSFDVAGTLLNTSSEVLIPDRVIIAPTLNASITPEGLEIAGAGTLDGLPFDMAWFQPFGDAADNGSNLVASVELSQRALDTFEIGLPPGTVSGEGRAEVTIDLPRGGDPVMRLTSDLADLTVSVPALAWRKPPGQTGNLEVSGTLGEPVQIDGVSVEAPGFSAAGFVELGENGVFQSARFDNVRSGNWFAADVEITGRGAGRDPIIALVGGEINLREAPFDETSAGSGGPLTISLDRLRVAETIAIQPFQANLTSTGPLQGTFQGRVNGGAQVRGSIVPTLNGSAFRILGNDAGDIMRDAGVFASLDDGSFDMILRPRPGRGFDGQLQVRQTRLSDQPALAALLDAVSIVGILDELNGPGIYFDSLDARFRLLPQGVIVDQSAAVGASLGVSLDGFYEFETNRVDMQGVVSPIYLLNGIGQIFTRRGEGLFGFAFNMTGDADAPRVAVNPLSILTPGMFREIFRRPPPSRSGSN